MRIPTISLILITSLTLSPMMADKPPIKIHPKVSLACQEFSFHLHKKTLSSSSGENVITSPCSAHILLSLLAQGANGATLTEMRAGLHLDQFDPAPEDFKSSLSLFKDIKGIKLRLANALYIQNGFELLPKFLELSKDKYNTLVSRVDYRQETKAAKKINKWVRQETKNSIDNTVSPDDFKFDTRLVLINAIHFKGQWLEPFLRSDTKYLPFYVTKSNYISVPTMYQEYVYLYGDLKDWKAKFLEISYAKSDFAMTIVLPNEIEGLRSLEEKFSWHTLRNTSRSQKKIELYLPKFKVEAKIDLKKALNELGMKQMFTTGADFSGLATTSLMVSEAYQKVYIEVDEQGYEEAAICSFVIDKKVYESKPEKFVVDHPFMIVIQHKPSDTPLFVGSIRNIP